MTSRTGIAAILAAAMAVGAAGMPPEGPPTAEAIQAGLRDPRPEVRANAAAAFLTDARPEIASAAERIITQGEPAEARELLLFLADRPDSRFCAALVAATRRPPSAEAAETALDALGRRAPADALSRIREGLEGAPLEDRSPWITALGFVRSERAIPPLVALLPSSDADAAMAALRRVTTLTFVEPRDWNFWWDRHRNDSLEEILRDAARRLREENASLKGALERETARANELEKAGLRERLLAAQKKKDSEAEKAILDKQFASAQPALRAWAAQEAAKALQPADYFPAVLRLLSDDPVPAVRVAAARSAGDIGKENAVDALRKCLDDEIPALRVAGVDALAKAAGDKAAPDIVRMLGASQPRAVREAAIAALKGLKPKGFAAAAATLLEAELGRPAPESVAAGLIELLGSLRDEAGIDVLVKALRTSTDKSIRFRAVKSLGEIGTPPAAAPLIAELDRPAAEQEKDVVAEAVTALAQVGGDAARARLEKALGEFIDHDNPNPKARENAARGLARAGTLASVDPLLKCAKSDPDAAVRKEAWAAALALSDAAAARLDALQALLGKIGDAEADATWRIVVRGILVKPGNFEAARAKGHLKLLADDYFLQKDWANALKWYGEVVNSAPEDTASAARVVTCRVRAADLGAAVTAGAPLVARLAPGAPGFAEARLALIEARCALNEPGRARVLCPDDGALAVLPAADRVALAAERTRLDGVCARILADVEKQFPAIAAKPDEGWKEYVILLKSAPPAATVEFLAGRAESADAAERTAAAKALEALTGIAIPPEEGDPRKAKLEEARAWPGKLTP
ncbi:MAG: HEAT repeat domain-containing protein [Planctomycetota bacterium]